MSKSRIKYKLSFLKLSSFFPLVMLFFTLAIGNSSYSFASASHQISFSQDYTRLSDVSDIKVLVNPIITEEKSNCPDPYSKYAFSEKTEGETEDDNKEEENLSCHQFNTLFGEFELIQSYNNHVYLKFLSETIPLYILFHSWKTHLI